MKSLDQLSDDDIYIVVTCLIQISDLGKSLWTEEDRVYAANYFIKKYKEINLDKVVNKFGLDYIQEVTNNIIKYRIFEINVFDKINEVNKKVECTLCHKNEYLYRLSFYLVKEIEKKRDWTDTLISIGVSAITIPLFGRFLLTTPSLQKKMKVINLDFKLCERCAKNYKTILGKVKIDRNTLRKHPAVIEGEKIGYTQIKYEEEI